MWLLGLVMNDQWFSCQMEKQHQEMERMRKDLLAQKAELDLTRSTLGKKEMV